MLPQNPRTARSRRWLHPLTPQSVIPMIASNYIKQNRFHQYWRYNQDHAELDDFEVVWIRKSLAVVKKKRELRKRTVRFITTAIHWPSEFYLIRREKKTITEFGEHGFSVTVYSNHYNPTFRRDHLKATKERVHSAGLVKSHSPWHTDSRMTDQSTTRRTDGNAVKCWFGWRSLLKIVFESQELELAFMNKLTAIMLSGQQLNDNWTTYRLPSLLVEAIVSGVFNSSWVDALTFEQSRWYRRNIWSD